MFQFLNYDFLSGKNCMASGPKEVNTLTSTKLSNAIFDHFNVTHEVAEFGNSTIPDGWTYDTILNADFSGNISAGNLEYLVQQIDSIKIKRRIKPRIIDEYTPMATSYEWITLKEIPVYSVDDLQFVFDDFLNVYGEQYEYALVPVVSGVEGNYVMNTIVSNFKGVFIGDAVQTFKLLYDVDGNRQVNQQIGTFAALGKKYPILIANGDLSYNTGSTSATVLDDGFDDTGRFDRRNTVDKVKILEEFLNNKKPKFLKDWNGNAYLCVVTDSPQVGYQGGSGMGVPHISFGWTEIGDIDNQQDLYDAGLVDTLD